MCDTVVALPVATDAGVMLFGKNSDRQRNEAQGVELQPAADYSNGAKVSCTYIEIPQARHTHAVLLCRPFWMWGAEMGANELGVVIGNEGVQARTPASEQPALTGMDLVRLGLERAVSAADALGIITTLLEKHGQGGNCGHLTPAYYNNSFIIADASEAFVLETVNREWLVEKVQSTRAISNDYSIGSDIQRTSAGLRSLVREFGASADGTPNYAEVLKDPKRSHVGSASDRRERATTLLRTQAGRLSALHVMAMLRDHGARSDIPWSPKTAPKFGICVHAGVKNRDSQTTGALVSEVGLAGSVPHSLHWVTATAATCLSVFKPVFLDAQLPEASLRPTDRYDPRTLWWAHERLHRRVLLGDLPAYLREIQQERDSTEARFRARATAVSNAGTPADRLHVMKECWREAADLQQRWLDRVTHVPSDESDYAQAWAQMNQVAGLESSG